MDRLSCSDSAFPWMESFSGSARVVLQGEPILDFSAGLANRDTGTANHTGTRYATASVSKMFTALCMARLVQAGQVRFDDALTRVLPELAEHFHHGMTISSLLCHCSGLGDYIDDDAELPFSGLDVDKLDHPAAFLPLVLEAARGAAGTFRYSSAGYILLGLAVERIAGLPFPLAMEQLVLRPVGMTNTGFPRLNDPDVAVGYLRDGMSNAGHLPGVGGPDGGIVTTIPDLQQLFGSLRDVGFLRRDLLNFLWQPVSSLGDAHAYGHGFHLIRVFGREWPGHTGSDPGVSARVAFDPHTDSSIMVLSNQDACAFTAFRHLVQWVGGIQQTRH